MNANPSVSQSETARIGLSLIDGILSEVNTSTIFEIIRDIQDPEHPYTLEQLNVIKIENIEVTQLSKEKDELKYMGLPLECITVYIVPTIPHCSMAGIIGLSIHYQLSKYVSDKYWIRVYIADGAHVNYKALNKQLNDRDRVLAALENNELLSMFQNIVPMK